MFKTREDSSILYAPHGWWSKKSYVLLNIQLKNRIRYIRLVLSILPLPILFLALYLSKHLTVISILVFCLGLIPFCIYPYFEKKWLEHCEQVDEKTTFADSMRDKWLIT